MPATEKKDSAISSRKPLDRWLVRFMTALAIAVGLLVFVMCGGLWLAGFVAFAVVLTLWGEKHILPWMFFIAVVGGVAWLVAALLGYSL